MTFDPMTDDRKRKTGGEVDAALRALLEHEWVTKEGDAILANNTIADLIQRQSRALAESRAEVEEARGMVIEANNSLYGSQGYFHSLDGGAYDRHHLSRGIEGLKARSNAEWRRAERLAGALREMLELRQATQDGRITERHELEILADARAALNLEPRND